jgi:hypothetical protein
LWHCNPLWFLVFDVPGHRFCHPYAAYSWVPRFCLLCHVGNYGRVGSEHRLRGIEVGALACFLFCSYHLQLPLVGAPVAACAK